MTTNTLELHLSPRGLYWATDSRCRGNSLNSDPGVLLLCSRGLSRFFSIPRTVRTIYVTLSSTRIRGAVPIRLGPNLAAHDGQVYQVDRRRTVLTGSLVARLRELGPGPTYWAYVEYDR